MSWHKQHKNYVMLEDMKCSNCSNEMIQSRAGWLCISCGHIESVSAEGGLGASIATGKDGHDQSRAAAAGHALAGDKPAKAGSAEEPPPPPSQAAPWETGDAKSSDEAAPATTSTPEPDPADLAAV